MQGSGTGQDRAGATQRVIEHMDFNIYWLFSYVLSWQLISSVALRSLLNLSEPLFPHSLNE